MNRPQTSSGIPMEILKSIILYIKIDKNYNYRPRTSNNSTKKYNRVNIGHGFTDFGKIGNVFYYYN